MGFDATTPTTPGHVFEVTGTTRHGTVDVDELSLRLRRHADQRHRARRPSGDLYASSDFGVFRLESGTTTGRTAAPGMPNVEVAGLTYVGKDRILYAATHGLGAWRLNLG